jgi:hypothetical protein
MGIIARIYDFVAGTKIKSADIDAELNQLVSAHNDHDTKIDGLQAGSGIADNSILNVKLATGIDAAKLIGLLPIAIIGDGTLTSDKFVAGSLTNDTQNGLRITALETDYTQFKKDIELLYWMGDV